MNQSDLLNFQVTYQITQIPPLLVLGGCLCKDLPRSVLPSKSKLIRRQGKRARLFAPRCPSPLSVVMLKEPSRFVITQWWFSLHFPSPFSARGGIWQCLETVRLSQLGVYYWHPGGGGGRDAAKQPARTGSPPGHGRIQPQMSITPRWRRLPCFPFSPTRGGETTDFYVLVAAMERPPHFPSNVPQKQNREYSVMWRGW